MSRDSILVVAVLCVLALGTLYAVFGSYVPSQWRAWITNALLAAAGAYGIGMLLLGLPGALFVEAVTGPELPPDSAWPLSIVVTQVGALLIVPASLLLRFMMPATVGWGHVGATAVLTFLATFVAAILIARIYVP